MTQLTIWPKPGSELLSPSFLSFTSVSLLVAAGDGDDGGGDGDDGGDEVCVFKVLLSGLAAAQPSTSLRRARSPTPWWPLTRGMWIGCKGI